MPAAPLDGPSASGRSQTPGDTSESTPLRAAESAPASPRDEPGPLADSGPAVGAPSPASPSVAEAPPGAGPAAGGRPAATLPPRTAAAPATTTPRVSRQTPTLELEPAQRTARYLVQTYGALDAETRALTAAEFYTGEDADFWRRVLAYVRSER
jgi:predicted lipid-binding transport protein (Tim44 family)